MRIELAPDMFEYEDGAVVCFVPLNLFCLTRLPSRIEISDAFFGVEYLDVDNDLSPEEYAMLIGNTFSYLEESGNDSVAGIPIIHWNGDFFFYTREIEIKYEYDGDIEFEELPLVFNARINAEGKVEYKSNALLEWLEEDLERLQEAAISDVRLGYRTVS